jgi:nitrite reductase (NADH) small subunit
MWWKCRNFYNSQNDAVEKELSNLGDFIMENWQTICALEDIAPNVGVCALVDGEQVAIFRCTRTQSLYAVSNYDPIGKANVLSRGIIGSIEGRLYVASPLYKQHFNLTTGECLEKPEYCLKTYSVRENGGQVEVQIVQAAVA